MIAALRVPGRDRRGAHIGPSGRFVHLTYEAEVCAWVLDRLLGA